MEFSVNSPIIFILVGVLILVVLAQSFYFLRKALRRGKELGMDPAKLKKTMSTAAVFTIAPAVAIVIGVMTLSKDLGIPLPWLRLSVVGALTYETVAATNAESAMGLVFGQVSGLTASQFVTIALVMTISIMVGPWLCPLLAKRLQSGMIKMEGRDKHWSELFTNAMFIGMISAFLGYVFCDVLDVARGSTAGLIPVCVMLISAVIMALCGTAMKKLGWKWMGDYALPISLVLGMASAIPITAWLG